SSCAARRAATPSRRFPPCSPRRIRRPPSPPGSRSGAAGACATTTSPSLSSTPSLGAVFMAWPTSQDYNEAVQSPRTSFSDPELRQGEAVCNALGLPLPCSGNFADVYALQTPQRKWAVKCFTRQIPGLRERYVEISKYLAQVNLPFMVEFKFLDQGIRVRGECYPVLKMHWVEGSALNTFVKQQLDKPPVLHTLSQISEKMAVRL